MLCSSAMLRTLALLLACTLAATTTADESAPSLAEQLQEMTARSADRLPPDMLDTFASAIDEVRETGIEKSARQVGDRDVDGKVNFYSLEKEIKLGRQLAQQIEQNAKIIDDPVVAAPVVVLIVSS